jgi:hypothetical protein
VAAADRLDQKGLLSLLTQRKWLSDRIVSKIPLICSLNTPVGLCLKTQGILQAEQLMLLFRIQVVGQVTSLFELKDGKFEFEPTTTLPFGEMTGLSLPATEATLVGLRKLQDWTGLAEKLPASASGLSSMITGQPQFRLDSQEQQVWEFAKGDVSLQAIALSLGLSIEKVQQIAFRLIVVNLAEEILITTATAPNGSMTEITPQATTLEEPTMEFTNPKGMNKSFLQNLVGFLKGKV